MRTGAWSRLRTYTDAWLFAVPAEGGVAGALRGTPVQVPLPGEPQGEALAFTADGTLLSGSETRGGVGRAAPGGPRGGGAARGRPDRGPGGPTSTDLPAEPVPVWRTAAIGAGVVVVILAVLALAMARHAARRR